MGSSVYHENMWTVHLPLAVAVSRKKNFSLNLNQYRNAHFQVLNKAKVEFTRVVRPLLSGVPRLEQCSLEYVLFNGKGTVPDTNNVCSVVDKFFCDTLVEAGVLPDDGPKYLVGTTFRYGGVDRDAPRVEVTIRSPNHGRNQEMRETTSITIEPQDVQQALKDFLVKVRPHVKGVESLEFKRADDGSYEVRFESTSVATSETPARALRDSKNKPALSLPAVTLQEPSKGAQVAYDGPGEALGKAPPPTNASPAPVLFARSEEPQVTADSPPPPPPKGGGLFADIEKVKS